MLLLFWVTGERGKLLFRYCGQSRSNFDSPFCVAVGLLKFTNWIVVFDSTTTVHRIFRITKKSIPMGKLLSVLLLTTIKSKRLSD